MKSPNSKLIQLILFCMCCNIYSIQGSNKTNEENFFVLADDFVCPGLPDATYSYTEAGWIENSTGYDIDQPSLNAGESVNILADFSGDILGAEITTTFYVGPGATMTGKLTKFVNATIIVEGTLEPLEPELDNSTFYICDTGQMIINTAFSIASGNTVHNAGSITFENNLILDSGATLTNYSGSTLNTNGGGDPSFQVNGTLENYGKVNVNNGNIYLNANASVTNYCTIYGTSDFSTDSELINHGLLLIDGSLELDSGTIDNYGIADFGRLVVDDSNGEGDTFEGKGDNSLIIVRTEAVIQNGGGVTNSYFYDVDDGRNFDNVCQTCTEDITIVENLTVPSSLEEYEEYIEQCGNDLNIGLLNGTLTGTVFNDEDNYGTFDTDEEGLPNISINITHEDGTVTTVTTDEDGNWSADILEGNATIAIDENTLPENATLTTENETDVVITANLDTDTEDFGYIITPTGTLTGTVFNDEDSNEEFGADEQGLSNISVTITHEDGTVTTVITDEEGNWTAENMPEGNATYSIDENTLPENANLTVGNQTGSVIITANLDTNTDDVGYAIIIPTGTLIINVFIDANENKFFDTDELGITNISVTITDSQGNETTITSDENGNWSADNIPEGSATITIDESTLPENATQSTDGPFPISVIANQENTINVGYTVPMGILNGTVFNDEDDNGALNDGESGFTNVLVTITDEIGSETTVTTTENGNWTAENIPEGNVTVTIDESTLPENANLTVGTNPNFTDVIAEENNYADTIGYNIPIITTTNTVTGRVYNDLNGNGIQDDNEPGKESVGVVIVSEDDSWVGANTDSNGDWVAEVSVSNVTIVISNELFPDAEITEGALTFAYTVTEGDTMNTGNVGYQIPDIYGSLEGVVYEDINNNNERDVDEPGIENVSINITDENNNVITISTDSDGYWFAAEVLISNAIVSVDKSTIPAGAVLTEGNDTDASSDVIENETVDTGEIGYFIITNTSSVTGFVYDDTNNSGQQDVGEFGLEGALINVTTADGTLFETYTASDGSWGINSVPVGSVVVTLIETSLRTGSVLTEGTNPQNIDLVADENFDAGTLGYNIPEEEGSLSGRVYNDTNGNGTQDNDEPGIEGAWIFVASEGQARTNFYTDSNGDWETTLVVSDDVTISIAESSLPTGAIQTEEFNAVIMQANTVVDAGSAGFTIPVEITTATLTGTIFNDEDEDRSFDNNEEGFANVLIYITDESGNEITVTTDSDGNWITEVTQGEVTITIDESTLPENAIQTTNEPNPITVTIDENGLDIDDYGFSIEEEEEEIEEEEEEEIEEEEEFAIYNAISPNGDGINDEMKITGISTFSYTKLMVFNRWYQTVYNVTNYDNESNYFKGYGDNGEVLTSGTYLYIFEYRQNNSSKTSTKSGYLYIKR